jgi:hypothetical protein
MNKYHDITKVEILNGALCLTVDGVTIAKDLKSVSPALAAASNKEQSEFEVSPSGYGIYWPLIDEDLSIDGLLGLVHRPETRRKSA